MPLFEPADSRRPIAWRQGAAVELAEFQSHVAAVSARLPEQLPGAMVNLCEDRYRFLVAYAAALNVGHTVLLPPSRAAQVVTDVETANAGSYRFDDATVDAALQASPSAAANLNIRIPSDHTVMVGYTSGSTGQPKSYPKSWRSVSASTACNADSIRAALIDKAAMPWLLATVPPQHMYGMELSILLPLIGGLAVHAGRPLFPADIAAALAELPRPRVLVSTPVHLRAMIESPLEFPAVDVVVSATAPLDRSLAAAVTAKLGGKMVEMFGSTETCVFASRHTAHEDSWTLYEGVRLGPEPDRTLVHAPWFVEPIPLQDIVELQEGHRFTVQGRSSDMIEVAGKRASLSDLTRRLLAIEGVLEAAVFQPDADTVGTIRRVAALVVAPNLTARDVLYRLAGGVDSAFMPRPLLIVDRLPRNELGKLPRENLIRALRGSRSG